MPSASTPGWYDKLDPSARGALQRAREESDRARLPYIGTEQLLLGLLAQPRGVTRRALRSFDLELDAIRPLLEQLRPVSSEHATSETQRSTSDLALTPNAKRAIELGIDYARTGGQASISTEHLLLGLLGLDDGTAVEFLRQRGIDFNALRARTRQLASRGARAPSRKLQIGVDLDPLPTPSVSNAVATVRSNVVMCRLDDRALEAIDVLIEAGVRANRSEAAAWLITVGLESKASVLDAVRDQVAEIRRLRESARALAEDAGANG
jgi:ATP-dependent Clp protease ATP-binding subunit ClpA